MKKQFFVLPVIMFAVVAVFAYRGLSIDGSAMPSVLMGKPAPSIKLEVVPGYPGAFDTADLKGQVSVLNVWGSWCVYCRYEHPVLLDMQAQGVKIYGIAWNDTPAAAALWLDRYGSPYEKVGLDQPGYAIAQFGVTGAPETYIIDKEGVIRYRHQGPVSQRQWEKEIRPLVEQLEAAIPGQPVS